MNILVCISNVPDTTSKINFVENDSKFDSNGVQYIINPNDEFGLTKAVWMKESNGANVTVLTVGNLSAEAILKAGTIFFIHLRDSVSNGVVKKSIFNFLQYF